MGDLIWTWLIGGIYVAIRSGYDWTRENLFGVTDKGQAGIKKRKEKLLYKKIRLIKDQNSGLKSGLKGVILEIIDKNYVFAEFYDLNGKLIERNNEVVFKIKINEFRLTK